MTERKPALLVESCRIRMRKANHDKTDLDQTELPADRIFAIDFITERVRQTSGPTEKKTQSSVTNLCTDSFGTYEGEL